MRPGIMIRQYSDDKGRAPALRLAWTGITAMTLTLTLPWVYYRRWMRLRCHDLDIFLPPLCHCHRSVVVKRDYSHFPETLLLGGVDFLPKHNLSFLQMGQTVQTLTVGSE
jgi:hypothetical protein